MAVSPPEPIPQDSIVNTLGEATKLAVARRFFIILHSRSHHNHGERFGHTLIDFSEPQNGVV